MELRQSLQQKLKEVEVALQHTFRPLSVTLKYLTLKALLAEDTGFLVQKNYLSLIENYPDLLQ